MTLNIFVLSKFWGLFELCHYFLLFLSNSGAVSVKTCENQFPVSYKLILVLVSYSTHGFFALILHVSFFLSLIAKFFRSFCFLVDLLHY